MLRHAQIGQDQFRTELFGLVDDLQTISSGPNNFELPLEFEVAADGKQSGIRVIGNDYANFAVTRLHCTLLGRTSAPLR